VVKGANYEVCKCIFLNYLFGAFRLSFMKERYKNVFVYIESAFIGVVNVECNYINVYLRLMFIGPCIIVIVEE